MVRLFHLRNQNPSPVDPDIQKQILFYDLAVYSEFEHLSEYD